MRQTKDKRKTYWQIPDTLTLAELQAAFKHDLDLNAKRYGLTPLMDAALDSFSEVIHLLIEHGADVHIPGPHGKTALVFAIEAHDLESTRYLLEAGANPNTRSTYGKAAIHTAAIANLAEMIELLHRFGAELRLTTKRGDTSLDLALEANAIESVLMLRKLGVSLESTRAAQRKTTKLKTWQRLYDETFPTASAIKNGDVATIQAMIDLGLDVNGSCPNGGRITPWIVFAAEERQLTSMQVLLNAGADPNKPDIGTAGKSIATAFLYAVKYDDMEMMILLRAAGAHIRAASANAWEPLNLAARNGDTATVRFLLQTAQEARIELDIREAIKRAEQDQHQDTIDLLRMYLREPQEE